MKRFGLLIPSSNVVLEELVQKTGRDAIVHISRLGVLNVKLEEDSFAQFELETQLSAAMLLCDAKVDAVVWGGTSASWLGFSHDLQFIDQMQQKTGIPTGSCVLEINRQLDQLAAKRLGLVMPYTADVANQIKFNYESSGYKVVAAAYAGGQESNDFSSIAQDTIAQMIRTVAVELPDAIVIMCTNVAGATLARTMREEVGCPIIDSAAATLSAFAQF